jgi:hypothetical protein
MLDIPLKMQTPKTLSTTRQQCSAPQDAQLPVTISFISSHNFLGLPFRVRPSHCTEAICLIVMYCNGTNLGRCNPLLPYSNFGWKNFINSST